MQGPGLDELQSCAVTCCIAVNTHVTNCSSVLNAIVLEFGGMGSFSVVTGYESLLLCTDASGRCLASTRFDNAQKLSKACGPECCSVRCSQQTGTQRTRTRNAGWQELFRENLSGATAQALTRLCPNT